ncbi:MAG: dTMP kinase [Aquificae bacterium]|nr:dTMP kinase [Aquificota bacterium]
MGVFITFEGIDGAGKSTQAKLLYEYLREAGKKTILTREPGGTETGKELRKILLSENKEKISSISELFLYEADRNIHVNNILKPFYEKDFYIVCDRYIDSTLAYQGYARGLDINLIKNLNDIAVEGMYPDITFLIDIPVEIALERLGEKKDRIEKEDVSFYKRLREGFLKIAHENKNRITIIDGRKKINEILKEIVDVLKAKGLL